MKKIISMAFVGVAALCAASPSMANPTSGQMSQSASSINAANNQQNNSGSVNLAPMGGSNANYQINSVSNSQFGFAPGIQCPTPEFALGVSGGQTNNWSNSPWHSSGNNIAATAMFTMPIGGRTAEYCKQLAREIAHQRKLDTKINMIKQCAQLANAGIQIDVSVFPEFKLCSGVTLASGVTAVPMSDPERIFTPEDTTKPVIQVNKVQ